ncbi:uncharacterized protein LOC121267294 [Juglans microcarpa x Juglans regia]|uniref:uncharacterized protein LOC121267294 n=1 Tax=Juglans microcarpa x Juglans regia TaxID=2249226 RepID=UPI001B7EFDCE|nr:uncharacterized protein LOC121267294 [Juglans microcarpa x Juglans regia]
MDACHVLLGRPYQYDRSVIHDWQKNTYSLSIKRKKIVLAPHRERTTPTSIATSSNLLSMSRFLDEIGHEDVIYILLPCTNSAVDMSPNLPAGVLQLLVEFSNLMPKDLPHRLLPMRDIQHQIDLVPGISLPNQLAYHLSPKESKESQHQEVELFERGYICESKSPCAVIAYWYRRKMVPSVCVLIVEQSTISQ